VDRLIIKGFVKKCTCPNDKRLVDVTITDKGEKLLVMLEAQSYRMDNIMSSLTEREAEQLSNLLDKLRTTRIHLT
jgi:DNA-binding MarR family transcriptional regulator